MPLVAEHARPRPNRRWVALEVAAAALVWAASAWAVRAGAPWWLAHPINTVGLLTVSILVGSWLAAELERPGHLVPLCVLAGGVDIWSALAGPTAHIAQQTSEHVARAATEIAQGHTPPPPPWPAFLIYVWPQPGAGGMATLVGVGDLVFLALLLAAARRFDLGRLRVGLALLGALGAAVTLALALHRPVPALPLLCGAFLAVCWPRLHLHRREWWITAATGALLGLGIALSLVAAR